MSGDKPPWAGDEHSDAYDPRDPIPEWEIEWMAREIGSSIMTPEELLKQTALKSNGKAGEEAAEWFFKRAGWQMFKVAPPSRVVNIHGRPQVVYTGKGYPDYMGHIDGPDLLNAAFLAVEVKEAKPSEGDSVPCSRLTVSQRQFMTALPEGSARVGILWRDGIFEVFPFSNDRGSYKKGEGLK